MVLVLFYFPEDVSSLTARISMKSLRINIGNYVRSNLNADHRGMGHTLVELALNNVQNVYIAHIITLCSCLWNLGLEGVQIFTIKPRYSVRTLMIEFTVGVLN
jgi:hypothetical protein